MVDDYVGDSQNFGFDMVMVYLGILFAIAAAITFTLPLNMNVSDG